MKKLQIAAAVFAIGLVFSIGAMAQKMSKDSYQAAEDRIAAEYKSDMKDCDSQSGNAKDICVAQAKGKEKTAKAELKANYEPTAKHRYQALVAKAEAEYAVANEKCDDLAGNDKDVCVKEAKAAETRMKADAEAQLKTSEANKTAREERSEARDEAATEKSDANYAVAKEKCASLADDAKDRCLADAKAKYGK